MAVLAQSLVGFLKLVGGMGLVFGCLALLTKGRGLLDAMKRTGSEFATNLGLAFLNSVVLMPLLVLPSTWLHDRVPAWPFAVELWAVAPAAMTLVAAVLVWDFAVYWRHRAEHLPALWPFHATHHADTHYHWLTVLRKHPVSNLISLLVDVLLLLVLGFPPWAVAAAGVIRGFWGFFIHADVPWTLGPLGLVLISPAAHRLHHIRDEAFMGTNFGNTVTLWDHVFGTYADPRAHVDCETGIAEGTRNFWGELRRPWEMRRRSGGVAAPAADAASAT
ncbi:sterol desaturase family protein [Erythrobacteraceae bacterium CFH 75059]|uniref:sterol desaturase family protein n=1 Tax=Qipengyuania thermophila TaxID=2509361 RepID=UPI00101F77D8|nr:sterol desaturase family protein [Qipengyuania thermophila]TCD05411.1 sterol desaturase family protein [Erythrobacteraceae bacterium CFH 75059]